jgi:hypothetical protein
VTRQYASQRCEVELALFPGFVFARGSIEALRSAQPGWMVQSIHQVENQGAFRGQMQDLSLALGPDVPPADQRARLGRGDGQARVLDGLLAILEQACGLGIASGIPRAADA